MTQDTIHRDGCRWSKHENKSWENQEWITNSTVDVSFDLYLWFQWDELKGVHYLSEGWVQCNMCTITNNEFQLNSGWTELNVKQEEVTASRTPASGDSHECRGLFGLYKQLEGLSIDICCITLTQNIESGYLSVGQWPCKSLHSTCIA